MLLHKECLANNVLKCVTRTWLFHAVLYTVHNSPFGHLKSPFWEVVPGNKMVPNATLWGGSQPATQELDRLSGNYGTQTHVIRRVAPVAPSTLHTIRTPRMSPAQTFGTQLFCLVGGKISLDGCVKFSLCTMNAYRGVAVQLHKFSTQGQTAGIHGMGRLGKPQSRYEHFGDVKNSKQQSHYID